jgi:hypothetical protein
MPARALETPCSWPSSCHTAHLFYLVSFRWHVLGLNIASEAQSNIFPSTVASPYNSISSIQRYLTLILLSSSERLPPLKFLLASSIFLSTIQPHWPFL